MKNNIFSINWIQFYCTLVVPEEQNQYELSKVTTCPDFEAQFLAFLAIFFNISSKLLCVGPLNLPRYLTNHTTTHVTYQNHTKLFWSEVIMVLLMQVSFCAPFGTQSHTYIHTYRHRHILLLPIVPRSVVIHSVKY